MHFSETTLLARSSPIDVLPKLLDWSLRVGLFLLLYFDSRAWFTKNNFVEVTGAQEAFLSLLLVYFAVAVVPRFLLTFALERNGLFVLAVVAFVLLVPACGAYLTYGQPIYAGMIEERRALSYLIFFPIIHAIRSERVSTRTVLNYVTGAAVLCLLNALLYYLLVSSVTVVESMASEADARADRTPIGTGFILIALCYTLSRYIEKPKLKWAFLWLGFVFDVVVLDQGRQTIMAVAVASVILLWGHGRAVARLALTYSLGFLAILPFVWHAVVNLWEKYIFLFELLSQAKNLRVDTLHSALSGNPFVPHGALWAQWNDGFAHYFGPTFFLSDIGVFGELFCYGAILLMILLICFYGYIIWQIKSATWNVVTRTCAAFVVILILLHAFQPVIEHGGFDIGVILALLAAEKRRTSPPSTADPSIA